MDHLITIFFLSFFVCVIVYSFHGIDQTKQEDFYGGKSATTTKPVPTKTAQGFKNVKLKQCLECQCPSIIMHYSGWYTATASHKNAPFYDGWAAAMLLLLENQKFQLLGKCAVHIAEAH